MAPKKPYIKRCKWHKSGVPMFFNGIRFYAPGCVDCEAKRTRGEVSTGDLSPLQLKRKMFPRGGVRTREFARSHAT